MDELDAQLDDLAPSATIRTALEQCMINLMIKNNHTSELSVEAHIKANGLISLSNTNDDIASIRELTENGYTTLKIKVGINDFSQELNILREIHSTFPELKLRLDVNGAWSYKAAGNNLNKLDHLNIEYVEQVIGDTSLVQRTNGMFKKDVFDHEIYLVIKEDKKMVLFSGCSHKGIKNIITTIEERQKVQFTHVIGGFHLSHYNPEEVKQSEYLVSLGKSLIKDNNSKKTYQRNASKI